MIFFFKAHTRVKLCYLLKFINLVSQLMTFNQKIFHQLKHKTFMTFTGQVFYSSTNLVYLYFFIFCIVLMTQFYSITYYTHDDPHYQE